MLAPGRVSTITMPRTIQYSEKYQDDIYEYRFDKIDHPLPQRSGGARLAPCVTHERSIAATSHADCMLIRSWCW